MSYSLERYFRDILGSARIKNTCTNTLNAIISVQLKFCKSCFRCIFVAFLGTVIFVNSICPLIFNYAVDVIVTILQSNSYHYVELSLSSPRRSRRVYRRSPLSRRGLSYHP